MALVRGLKGACEAILAYMANLQGDNYAGGLSKNNGLLDYLYSPYNLQAAGAAQLELEDQRGKIKRARVVYSQRSTTSEVLTGQAAIDASLCDVGTGKELKETFVDITDRIATRKLDFTNADLNEICNDASGFMRDVLFDVLRSAREKLDQVLLAQMQSNSGKIIGHDGTTVAAGTSKSLKLISINATSGERTPVFSTFNQIAMDFANMNLNGSPAIIGQGHIYEFFNLMGYACCNSTTPFGDAIGQSNSAFFLDQNANAVLGTNKFLVAAPGSAMLLTYNENVSLGIDTPIQKHITIQDPEIPGLMWDLDFRLSPCGKKYEWFASVWYKLWNTFQTDSFASPDPLRGMTGIFNYVATAS